MLTTLFPINQLISQGLESEHPILKIDETFFIGTYADTIGSHLLVNLNGIYIIIFSKF